MKKIVIIGAGGFGRECKLIIDRINAQKKQFELIGFYDDDLNLNSDIHGIPNKGELQNLIDSNEKVGVILGVGVPHVKAAIIKRLKSNTNLDYPTIIDPSAIIGSDKVTIGKGNVICAGVIITCDIDIKDYVTLNLSCTVGHDTTINSYASFMPSVNISGEVIIEENVYVGTGAKIINQLTIGKQTIVGAGAVVSKSLPEKCTAVGIPAKPIKFHD